MGISNLLYGRMEKGLDFLVKSKKVLIPDSSTPVRADENANLNMILWGDPQISCLSPLRSARVYSACLDVLNSDTSFDALVMLGDITEYGTECEYKFTQRLIEPIAERFENIFAVSGNHDIRLRNYKKQVQRFSLFLEGIQNGRTGSKDRYYFSKYVNGYKFIMLGSDRATFEASYISKEQLDWIDSELNSEKDSGKPVFVFNHQPLKRTNGLPVTFLGKGKWRGSVGRESNKLLEIFNKYDNVIYITGHLHYCTSKYTYEDCGNFKAISVPTVGVINHGSFSKFSQGYVLSVYDDKIVARSRVFGEGKYVGKEIDNYEFEIGLKSNCKTAENSVK